MNLNFLNKELNYSLYTENNIISNNETEIKIEDNSVKDDKVENLSNQDENDIDDYMSISDDNQEIEISQNNYNLLPI